MPETQFDRRQFMYATSIAGATLLAGCSGDDGNGGGGSGNGNDDGGGDGGGGDGGDGHTYLDDEPDYDGWFDSANNYEGTVDWTGQDEVSVVTGYNSLGYDPAAIAVSPGTTVTWEWNGEGGDHDVASQDDGPLDSDLVSDAGHTYSYTFDETGTFIYSCSPHEAAGMKGAVHVE